MCASALMRRDEGSATVLTIAVVAGIVLALSAFLTAGTAFLGYLSSQAALDEAALSVAETVVGAREGYPCTLASQRATDAGAASVLCLVRGQHVRLVWNISVLGLTVPIRAQSGAD